MGMKKITAMAVCGMVVFAGSAFAQFKPTHIPANATWVAQLDAKEFLKSAAAPVILQLLDEAALRQIAAIHAATGLNLTNDIDTVVLFGSGSTQETAALSLYGRFDSARITAILGMSKDFQNQALGQRSVLSWTDNAQQQNLCFVDPTHVILSRNTKAVMDAVKQADSRGGTANAALTTALTPSPKRFCVLQVNNVADFVADNQQLVVLKGTDSLILELSTAADSGDIAGSVQFKGGDVEQATLFHQVLLGLQAILTLQAKDNPEGALLAQQAKIERHDHLVNLRLNLPQQMLKQLVDAHIAKRQAQP